MTCTNPTPGKGGGGPVHPPHIVSFRATALEDAFGSSPRESPTASVPPLAHTGEMWTGFITAVIRANGHSRRPSAPAVRTGLAHQFGSQVVRGVPHRGREVE